ncbi:PREDICTED: alpha-humulene/(-)-(E)-beta-caryophyllene synthase-like [Camelina sativa]|uniref:Alpha-humulene/(-)-(E)-beta-caryophyllene synthase-like n=1 Tax=Camelina sativa TaxID=90675 RepID=A0ABM0X427_CAMSA|nr:PREDICTED: alpha-humulene/(-)-(E)-beta-caryophyllene synthase-like [Camelina sativa]
MELRNHASVAKVKSEEIDRPLADFPVNIWEHPLTTFSVLDLDGDRNKEKLSSLKDTVMESLLASRENPIENIKFIDVLCRLGVSYHFEEEIFAQLEAMFASHDFMHMIRNNEFDLYTVALVFQVLRQFGHKLVSDVFDKFKNKNGEFMEHLAEDARGLLCLYEAAHWSTHGEDILDEALAFARSNLEKVASRCSPHLAVRIKNALKHAYPRGISRIETRQYISYYEEEDTHDQTLLEFSKVDFNLVQMLHRKELDQVSRWYKNLELDQKLPYARQRTVEGYLWAVGAHFEPRYSQARIKFAIFINLLTLFDDTYDAFGTIEELESFTDAMLRWNSSGIEGLPESMKYLHHVVLDFFDKLGEETEKERRPGCITYAKRSMMEVAKAYLQEAKWLSEDYVATLKEYAENGAKSSCYLSLLTISFLGMVDEGTLDVLEWLSTSPPILMNSSLIGRFYDDLTSCEFEHKRKHVGTAIDCYMKQYGVSWEKAKEEIQVMALDLWKSLNQELMTKPHQFPFPITMRFLNLSRVIEIFYKYADTYTHSELLKHHVVSLFIDNIPI